MAANPAKIVERIRALGADVYLDGSKLKVANRVRLSDEAMAHIRENARAIADWLGSDGLTKEQADDLEKLLQAHPPEHTALGTWLWFVGQAMEIIRSNRELRRAA